MDFKTPVLPGSPAVSAPAVSHGRAVLVVENETVVGTAARRMLERHGYRVLEARHGADALARWRQHRAQIDTALTDTRMPEMSEPVLVAHLHRDQPVLPEVLMSGDVDEGATCAQGPDVTFDEKPFSGEALRDALDRVLQQR